MQIVRNWIKPAPAQPGRTLQEEAEMREKDRKALEASLSEVVLSNDELDYYFPPVPIKPFANDVPRVRTDLVIKPTGMPPEHWGLA